MTGVLHAPGRGWEYQCVSGAYDNHEPSNRVLCAVFRAANSDRMPIVIHTRSSFSRRMPYGAKEARIFLDSLLPSAPEVVVQIAHLAGGGDYNDTAADAAMGVFAEAVANRDPRTKHLHADVSGAVGRGLGMPVEDAATANWRSMIPAA